MSYVARVASVRSVGWGLSVGGVVLGVHVVRWVWEGAVFLFDFRESLLHFLFASKCVLYLVLRVIIISV